jgi:hypothetical protein
MSNNHVFGNKSTELTPKVSIGDPITQPGYIDDETNIATNVVATVHSYVPWKDDYQLNIVDVALAKPSENFVNGVLVNDYIVPTNETSPVKRGDTVYKVGRTTGLTYGKVVDLDFTSDINVGEDASGNPHYIRFTDQILIYMDSLPGDSGSLIINSANNKIVGLLFAGGKDENGRSYTIANKIRNVLAMAGVDLTGIQHQ